jgi:hypothetical protein
MYELLLNRFQIKTQARAFNGNAEKCAYELRVPWQVALLPLVVPIPPFEKL